MSTVGLSFGSPTSGEGFDVTATVASIVSNLQNVETPWKTQLSKLEAQDTTISSLGTLLSTLSTDLSTLTDSSGILAEKTGSSSNTDVLSLTSASNSAVAGTHTVLVNSLAQTSSGYLAEVSSATATISGSIVLQVGSGSLQTISIDSSDNTLSGLASTINSSGIGVTASVLSDSSGARLSLVSGTSGANGNITVSSNTISAAISDTLSYSGTAGSTDIASTGTLGAVASSSATVSGSLTIQVGSGTTHTISVDSSDNTLSGLASTINSASIGVTASVITNSDGTSSLQLTSDTTGSSESLTVDSSVTASSTALAYTSTVTGSNASLTVDGINLTSTSNTVSNLIPGLTMQLLATSTAEVQVVIGNYTTGAESALNQFATDYNKLISAVSAQQGYDSSGDAEPLFGSPSLTMLQQDLLQGIITQNPGGYLTAVSSSSATKLSGSIVIQAGTATAQTFSVNSSNNTLSGLAASINSADIGVTASVVTKSGKSTLTLTSQVSGSSGALTVSSALTAQPGLAYSDSGFTTSTADNGTLGSLGASGDTLSGTMTIQVGSGTTRTISLNSSNNTLSGLMQSINNAGIGVTASMSGGGTSLTLTSGTTGTAGALTINSSIIDTSSTSLNYTSSSDINSLSSLGISSNNDGTISLDTTTLDSLLNSDFSSVQALFQNANSWGKTFATTLTSVGTSSSTGMLAMELTAHSSTESTLNANISREEAQISAEKKSLTTELNSANEVLQSIPSQLSEVNELYSAITGYNQSS